MRVPGTRSAAEGKQASEFDDSHSHDPNEAELWPERDSGGWKLKVLALAGAVIIPPAIVVELLSLMDGAPLPPPPTIGGAPIKVQPPSDENIATSGDVGATLSKESARSADVKVVSSEEQPIDSAPDPLSNISPPEALVPVAADAAQPPAGLSRGTPVVATVDTPVEPAPIATPPPTASEFSDPKTVRAVSPRPDGTPIATRPLSVMDSGEAAQAIDAASPPAKLAPNAASETAGVAQRLTPNLDLPAKPSGKSSARVVAARTDTTEPSAATETPIRPVQRGTPVRSEKAARVSPKAPQAAGRAAGDAAGPPHAFAEQPVNPMASALARVFGELIGALAGPAGWAVQLAAPKSETEAKSDLARLNAKYASALNGAAIGVHKAQVNGATVYRLRVVRLSKADAAALCLRVKGDGGDCFIVKAAASSPNKGGRRVLGATEGPEETKMSQYMACLQPFTDAHD
jgi:SPOR domain